jgi:hypothetical protein
MQLPRLVVPRLAVWCSPGDLAIGGPGAQVVLHQVPPPVADVVALLDGHHRLEDLRAVCPAPWVGWLIDQLADRGLLAEGAARRPPLAVRVHGSGPLARRITMALAGCGAGIAPRSGREAGDQAVHIVAQSTVEADRILAADLVERRAAHLLVRVGADQASVGPFVIPGATSCLTCADLARRALDPTWPIQVFQLSAVEAAPPAWLSAWAAATAITQLMSHADGHLPQSASTTIELSAASGRVSYRWWPVDPQCPCRTPG